MSRRRVISWDGGAVSGVVEGGGDTGVLLAHGAGTDQDHPSIAGIRSGLARGGVRVMSFNYPYTERGSRRPDRTDVLVSCHRAAAEVMAGEVDRIFLAGRSMGGRMGTYLAADSFPVTGLVLYAYPLHPAGKPDKLRIEQFASITVPMLFFQGTNDALARMDLFDEHIAVLPGVEVVLLEGAGHGPRGKTWSQQTMTDRYVSGTLKFIERLSSGTR